MNRNGRGPDNAGPMTGRGRGSCSDGPTDAAMDDTSRTGGRGRRRFFNDADPRDWFGGRAGGFRGKGLTFGRGKGRRAAENGARGPGRGQRMARGQQSARGFGRGRGRR